VPASGWGQVRGEHASLGLLIFISLGALLFALFSFVRWQLAAGDARAYDAAPFCAAPAPADCKAQSEVSVVSTYFRYHNKSTSYFVSLQGTDGTRLPDVQVTGGWSRWHALTPGMVLSATSWRGQIVTLEAAGMSPLETIDNPDHQAKKWRTFALIGWGATIVSLAFAVWRYLQRVPQLTGPSYFDPDPTSPGAFQFSHVDTPTAWPDGQTPAPAPSAGRRRRRLLNQ
jgi:hypothetical protein